MPLAYRQAGERLGMHVIGHTPATAIVVRNGEVAGVDTPSGRIETSIVVDTAGAWARKVGRMALVDVPIQPVRHQLRITAPISGVSANQPVVRLIDAPAYVRPARGGLMFGGFESDPLPVDPDATPGFSMDQLPLDQSLNDQFAESLKADIDALDGATIQEERGGVFTMTADGLLMVGPSSQVHGFWMATGCNGTGFSLSSGVGYYLAEWITTGSPSIDLSPLDPNRFHGQDLSDQELRDAAVWQYANYYVPKES
jgi:glycine/D-amino acid oxidase-like deaminating enzyme